MLKTVAKTPAVFAAFAAIAANVFAASDAECHAIFDARKAEILFEVDRLDRAKSELDALQEATAHVIVEKDETLKKREAAAEAKLKEAEKEREKAAEILRQNERVLAQISELKGGKLTTLYTGMKAGNAGEIMNALDPYLAAEILSQLEPKIAAQVLSRVDPATAANITAILHKGPPYVKPTEQPAKREAPTQSSQTQTAQATQNQSAPSPAAQNPQTPANSASAAQSPQNSSAIPTPAAPSALTEQIPDRNLAIGSTPTNPAALDRNASGN
ncbi:MAG: hypothetical protein LBU73_02665 [Helicobacteraceae bacterium]|jgi:flagellar motility protein MotE (MotC chaperone)|nr:hypothetical protein [Helicobacteraceae bacterium]